MGVEDFDVHVMIALSKGEAAVPTKRNRLQAVGQIDLNQGRFTVSAVGGSGVQPVPLSLPELIVLEAFLPSGSLASVTARLSKRRPRAPTPQAVATMQARVDASRPLLIRMRAGTMKVYGADQRHDLTDLSLHGHQVLQLLWELGEQRRHPAFSWTRKSVQRLAERLEVLGLIVPPPGKLELGDWRRLSPLCPNFGMTRGTVIDRYYLNHFVDQIRSRVQGRVLEIGGTRANQTAYRFDGVREYWANDLKPSPDVTHPGDVLEPGLFPPDHFDAIVCFNVLEHVRTPWVVIANIHRWLKPGGCALAMVPTTQRIHGSPKDYWRFLPDAVEDLFSGFVNQRYVYYGNPLTAAASLMGVAAEELTPAELDTRHPDYVVISCVAAQKG